MIETLLKDVRLPNGQPSDVLLRDGIIARIGRGIESAGASLVHGKGRWVLPAGIDFHVHFRTPGASYKESLFTGSRAAVKGGIATCGDMPNTQPPTTVFERLEAKVGLTSDLPAQVYCHFGAEPDNFAEVRYAARHPKCKAIKVFIGPSTGHGGLAPATVESHFRNAADLDLPVIVHAEDIDLINAAHSRFPHDARHHSDLRPLEAELSAVRFALSLAKKYPVRLTIAHSTSAEVIELAEQSGIRDRVFVEVTPHHLVLTSEHIVPADDNRFKVNPPLRPESVRGLLAARLVSGIDGLGSDHAPHTLAEKGQPYDAAPSGIPGVEYQMPLAISWWREGKITIDRLIELTSGGVARFYGLNKGRVAEGADADLILVSPDETWTVGRGDDAVASQCGYSLYEGLALKGRIEMTLVAGQIAWTRAEGWKAPVPPRWATSGSSGSGGRAGAHQVLHVTAHDSCCD
jgi:dihydroorotase